MESVLDLGKKLEKEVILTASLSLGDWVEQYLDYAKSNYTQRVYNLKRRVFQRFFRNFNPDMSVDELTPGMIHYHLTNLTRDMTNSSINADLKNIKSAWSYGVRFIDGFPFDQSLDIPLFKTKQRQKYISPEEDFWLVYDVAGKQDRIMLLCYLYLAARRREIFRLKWQDIDFQNDRIRLWTRKRKGGLESDWLPLIGELRSELVKWWDERPVKHENVFVSLYEGDQNSYGKPFRDRETFLIKLCRKAGVKYFSYHAIRHLTATRLYRDGYPVSVIQAILRHKNPNTTTRYLHTIGFEHVRDALESLSRTANVIDLKKAAKNM